MVEGARLSASAGNLQRLRFTPALDKAACDGIFSSLAFAAYLGGWRPNECEKPTAYIVLWSKNEPDANLLIDAGIAAQSILLTAREMGLGGCIFRSFNKNEICRLLSKEDYFPTLVIALGVPSEEVEIVDAVGDDIKYYRAKDGTHVVPKRPLDDIII